LDDLARRGAQRMLAEALEAEVSEFLERHAEQRDATGRRLVVRNGHLPERTILAGPGPLTVRQPRVRDRRGADAEDAVTFTSSILPPYLRRSKLIDELIPWLYLRGISTSDFPEALQALAGPEAKALSAKTIQRLTTVWEDEFEVWNRRDLAGREYVYLWADGVHFNIRLGEERQCILVIVGATREGVKELLGILDGYREDKESWKELLLSLRARGLRISPKLMTGDGALGLWAALPEVFPETREQRCWVHKTGNILSKLPKALQAKAKAGLHEIWMAETRAAAEKAFDAFITQYEAKYPKATHCLAKDREALLTFYDFPAEHWIHVRTTNPIESTFDTVRHRHRKTKGSGSRKACLTMVFKLMQLAERHWRKLNAVPQILHLLAGYKFVDGIMQERAA
jgi:transposase-like protein